GSAWRIQELAENGGSQTIYKRGFVFEDGAARVTYGADARHISDLSDPDANFFLLFGGEDGYMQSPTTTDQIERWGENRLIQVPLNADSIRSWKLTILRPLTNASGPP
ncbi:MAG: penicillin acylase family protein, partial [Leptospiraceae bacterium]|nr:penicillin acylase family protein [Leptospiraceae bacterium]